jgi:hypothetical protein
VSTDQDLDFSSSTIPESWYSAADDAGADTTGPTALARRRSPLRYVPTGSSVDVFSAVLAGLVASGLIGLGWYYLESRGILITPWTALVVGAALAALVRAGGGPDDPGTRSILSLAFYLITSSAVIVLVARGVFSAAYGSDPGLGEFEQSLLHSRFAEPMAVACWLGGGLAAVQVSQLLRRRS